MDNVLDKIKNNKWCNYVLMVVAAFIVLCIIDSSGATKYALIVGATAVCALPSLKKIDKRWIIILLPNAFYSLLGLILAIVQGNVSVYTLKFIVFLLVPVVASILIFAAVQGNQLKFIEIFFWIMVATYTVRYLPHYDSINMAESSYGFAFGAFCIYFFSKKEWIYSLVAAVVCILAHKRIAWCAVIACVLFIGILWLIKNEKVKIIFTRVSIILSIVLAYCWAAFDITHFSGDDFSLKLHDLSRGRTWMWTIFREDVNFTPLNIGKGLGFTLQYLEDFNYEWFLVLHNDFLQMFADIGAIGMIIFLALIAIYLPYYCYKLNNINKCIELLAILLYTFILWTTDNTIVYIIYWVPAWLIILNIIFPDDSDCGLIIKQKE